MPVEDVLRRNDQRGEDGTIRSFGPERESAAHFRLFDKNKFGYFESGGNWRNLKISISTFDCNKKHMFFSYQAQSKMFGSWNGFEKVMTGEQPGVYVWWM